MKLPDCELLQTRKNNRICLAAGGSLVFAGTGCNRLLFDGCTIPDALVPEEKPCLYLVPLRLPEYGAYRSYHACRWFYRLDPRRLMRSNRKVLEVVTAAPPGPRW